MAVGDVHACLGSLGERAYVRVNGGRSHADSWTCALAGERPYRSSAGLARGREAGAGHACWAWCKLPGLAGLLACTGPGLVLLLGCSY